MLGSIVFDLMSFHHLALIPVVERNIATQGLMYLIHCHKIYSTSQVVIIHSILIYLKFASHLDTQSKDEKLFPKLE